MSTKIILFLSFPIVKQAFNMNLNNLYAFSYALDTFLAYKGNLKL